MTHRSILSPALPKPVGPYSPGVGFERLVFVSGQGATDPATGQLAGSDVATQTEQCLENVRTILQAAGTDLQHVLRCGVFLIDMPTCCAPANAGISSAATTRAVFGAMATTTFPPFPWEGEEKRRAVVRLGCCDEASAIRDQPASTALCLHKSSVGLRMLRPVDDPCEGRHVERLVRFRQRRQIGRAHV